MYNIHSCKINSSIEKEEKIAGFLISICKVCLHLGHYKSVKREQSLLQHWRYAAWQNMTDLNDRWKSWCRGCTHLSVAINTWIEEAHMQLLKENRIMVPVGKHWYQQFLLLKSISFTCWWQHWAPVSYFGKKYLYTPMCIPFCHIAYKTKSQPVVLVRVMLNDSNSTW